MMHTSIIGLILCNICPKIQICLSIFAFLYILPAQQSTHQNDGTGPVIYLSLLYFHLDNADRDSQQDICPGKAAFSVENFCSKNIAISYIVQKLIVYVDRPDSSLDSTCTECQRW